MREQYEVISWEAIKHAVPPSFEAMHHYLNCIDYGGDLLKNGVIKTVTLIYSLPYRSELGVEGFVCHIDDIKKYFKNCEIHNHYIPDMENPEYWEYERKMPMMKNPVVRIDSQTITVTLKNKIQL